MKKVIVAVFFTLLCAALAFAQNTQKADKRVFFFGAPGVITGTESVTAHDGSRGCVRRGIRLSLGVHGAHPNRPRIPLLPLRVSA